MSTFGPCYSESQDGERLAGQMERIKALMLDGQWRSLREIAEATHTPEASCSAILRHYRKDRFGAYRVEKRHIRGGLWEYQLLEPVPAGQLEMAI